MDQKLFYCFPRNKNNFRSEIIPTLFFLLLQLRQKTSSKYKKSKVNKKNPLKKTQKTTHPKQKTTTIVVVLDYGKNKILHTTIVDAKKVKWIEQKNR